MIKLKRYDNINYISEPKLEDKLQWYVYVIENDRKDIKVGISHNVKTRMKSLSNSNAGGSCIIRCAVSPPTYLKTMEGVIHDHFQKNRVNGSEWFKDITFEETVEFIESLFNQKSYNSLNEMRKNAKGYGKKRIGGGNVKNNEDYDY